MVVTSCGRQLYSDTVKSEQEDAMVEEGKRQRTSLSRARIDSVTVPLFVFIIWFDK